MQKIFKSLNPQYFKNCDIEDINIGDIIQTSTFTNSQKYFERYGYGQYNMTKTGILIEKNEENFADSEMLKFNFTEGIFTREKIYSDPGTSGGVCLAKYYSSGIYSGKYNCD